MLVRVFIACDLTNGVQMNYSMVVGCVKVADTSDYEGVVRLSVAKWALLIVYIGLWKDS